MKLSRGPTTLEEPSGGADGREVGKQRELQARLDEFSAWKYAETHRRQVQPTPAVPQDAAALLWARAESICARNGLGPSTDVVRQPSPIPALPGKARVQPESGHYGSCEGAPPLSPRPPRHYWWKS